MPALSDYTAGTITLTNGSTAFTGSGTGWQAADFREGDTILGIEDNAGVEYVIASITGNGAGTLTQEWEGATGTYQYRMRYMADGARVTAQARNLIELLGNGNLQALAGLTLGSGDFIVGTGGGAVGVLGGANLQALAGLDGSGGDKLVGLTGPGAAATYPLTPFARTLLDDADANAARATLGANNASNLTTGTLPDGRVSSTLTPDKAFRRGNVLGAVSQAGGVPTGALIEVGGVPESLYWRFADGLQICTFRYANSKAVNIPLGTGFFVAESRVYAASFAAGTLPNVSVSASAAGEVILSGPTEGGSNTTASFYLFSPRSTSVTVTLFIDGIAIGKWF